MFEFFLHDANILFTSCILLVLTIGLFEGVGTLLGISFGELLENFIPNIETNIDSPSSASELGSDSALSKLLGWLRLGRVPALIWLILLLTSTSLYGFIGNFVAHSIASMFLPAIIAAPIAFYLGINSTRWLAVLLERAMPKDQTSSVSLSTLIGREAFITLGIASQDKPAEAKVKDKNKATHYILVKPEDGHEPLTTNTPLLLVRREDNVFVAIHASSNT